MSTLQIPADCTCDGLHTAEADGISVPTLSVLIRMEDCPAERRALSRIIARRLIAG